MPALQVSSAELPSSFQFWGVCAWRCLQRMRKSEQCPVLMTWWCVCGH